jgi:hypothetical protein
MFKRTLEHAAQRPSDFQELARDLFRVMRQRGRIGFENVEWFNGGLFDSEEALALESDDIKLVLSEGGAPGLERYRSFDSRHTLRAWPSS